LRSRRRRIGSPEPDSRERNAAKLFRDGVEIPIVTSSPEWTTRVTFSDTTFVATVARTESSWAPMLGRLRQVMRWFHGHRFTARAKTRLERWWFVRVSSSVAETMSAPPRFGTRNATKARFTWPASSEACTWSLPSRDIPGADEVTYASATDRSDIEVSTGRCRMIGALVCAMATPPIPTIAATRPVPTIARIGPVKTPPAACCPESVRAQKLRLS
jgi:hypothetical protein